MPMAPQGRVALVREVAEPELIEMPIPPSRRVGKVVGESGKLIEKLEPKDSRCAFFPLPAGKLTLKQFANKIRSVAGGAHRRNPEAKFTVRETKCGAVEGVGVWRTA